MKKCILSISAFLVTVFAASAGGFGNVMNLPDFTDGKAHLIVRAGVGFDGVTGSFIDTQKAVWNAANNGKHPYDGTFQNTTGYVVSVGFDKSFGNIPLYWGMDIAFSNRGYKTDASVSFSVGSGNSYTHHSNRNTEKLFTHNVKLTPFTIGYKYVFLERFAADAHLGFWGSYDFAGNYEMSKKRTTSYAKYPTQYNNDESKSKISDLSNMHKYDAGLSLGAGIWFGHFNIDFAWQRGFIPMFDNGDETIKIKSNVKRERGNLFTNNFQLTLGFAF